MSAAGMSAWGMSSAAYSKRELEMKVGGPHRYAEIAMTRALVGTVDSRSGA